MLKSIPKEAQKVRYVGGEPHPLSNQVLTVGKEYEILAEIEGFQALLETGFNYDHVAVFESDVEGSHWAVDVDSLQYYELVD